MHPNASLLKASWTYWLSRSSVRPGPRWWQYGWTFVFSSCLALAFTIVGFAMFGSGNGAWRNLAGWWLWYRKNLVVSLCVGYAIHFAFDLAWAVLGAARISHFRGWQRVVFFAGLPMAATAAAWPIGLRLVGIDVTTWFTPNAMAGSVLMSLLISFISYQFFKAKARQIEAERGAAVARLQLLQAQIEPHFLFNTLANVVGLMDDDTPRARLMLESFIDYLRGTLGSLRRDAHTLGDEVSLVEAYLRIIEIRMHDRLSYRIDVPDALRDVPLPALTLQPLVENAIHHGIEPKIEGGHLDIRARSEGGVLVLSVTDDGLGLGATRSLRHKGSGTALANIRERLAQAHGERGRLQIDPALPHGVRAVLNIPMPQTP